MADQAPDPRPADAPPPIEVASIGRRLPRGPLLLGAALVAVTLATYGNALGNGFVWDDGYIIVDNPATRDLASAGTLLLSPDVVKPYYRPVTRTSYLLDYAVFGMSARAFHAVNVAVHLANVLLLFGLGLRLFARTAPAFVAALLLALHPVNAEAVNFVSARNNLLALLFALLALHLLSTVWERGRPWVWSWLSGLSWFLALLSKESAAAAILFFGGWVLSPMVPPRVSRRARLLSLLPHCALAGVYLVLRRLAIGGVVGEGLGFGGLLRAIRINYHVVPRYLELVVFPARLNLFHRTPEAGPAAEPWLVVAWIVLAALAALLLVRRSIPALLGLLWIAVNFAPISNLVPIPSAAMAERYLYLPAVGLWIVLADRLGRLWDRATWRGPSLAALVACSAALGATTVRRNAEWKDEVSLFGSIVRVDPGSVTGHYNLGCALRERGDLEGARREWERAVALDPRHGEALGQLGTVAAIAGDLRRAELLYLAALDANVGDATVLFNLAKVYEGLGHRSEALARYEQFLRSAAAEHAELVQRARERRALLAGSLPASSTRPSRESAGAAASP